MKNSIEEYCHNLREHVAKTQKKPEDIKLSNQAINAFIKAKKTHKLTNADLEKIASAFKSTHLGPCYIGMDLFAILFNEFSSIEALWSKFAESQNAHERWVAIIALREEIPVDFMQAIVQKAIYDKSAKVRQFAIEKVLRQHLISLLPDLKNRVVIEQNRKVSRTLELIISLLEVGKYETTTNDHKTVLQLNSNGHVTVKTFPLELDSKGNK